MSLFATLLSILLGLPADMVAIAEGREISVGREVVVLASDGRIREDYQFIDLAA